LVVGVKYRLPAPLHGEVAAGSHWRDGPEFWVQTPIPLPLVLSTWRDYERRGRCKIFFVGIFGSEAVPLQQGIALMKKINPKTIHAKQIVLLLRLEELVLPFDDGPAGDLDALVALEVLLDL